MTEITYKGYEIIYDLQQVYWTIWKDGKEVLRGFVDLNDCKEWIDRGEG